MKKILSLLALITLISTTLIGCSSGEPSVSQKTEEELRAEIKAEMEAEQKMREEIEAKVRAEMEAEQKENEEVDMEEKAKDQDNVEVEKEPKPIVLSALMTKDEIINKLGNDYTFETKKDGGYFLYYSVLEYDGIRFAFYHDTEKMSADKFPDDISITSNKYIYNFGFKVGDPALKAFEYCENNFKNAYDRHSDTEMFDYFVYKEKKSSGEWVNTGLILKWEYDKQDNYSSKSQIPEDVKIKSISIFELLD